MTADAPAPARAAPAAVPWGIGATLALAFVLPATLGGVMVVDWTDTVERGVVGLLEAAVVLAALATRPAASGTTAPDRVARIVLGMLAAWGMATLASLVGALYPAPALVRTAEWGLHAAFGWVLWEHAARDPAIWTFWRRGALAGLVLVVVGAVVGWARLPDPLAASVRWDVPFVHGPRWLGTAGLLALTLGVAMASGAPARRLAFVAGWATLGWGLVWWSGSRGALGAAVVGLGVLVVARGLPWRGALAVAGGAAAGAGLSVVLRVPSLGMGLSRLGATLDPSGADFGSGRSGLWKTTLELWRDHPWLGAGPDGVAPSLHPVGSAHAHNTVVQALGEGGLVGALPFLAFWAMALAVAVWRARSGPTAPPWRAMAAAYLAAGLANGLLDGLLYDPASTLLLVAAAALALTPVSPTLAAARPVAPPLMMAMTLVAAAVMVVHLVVARAVAAPGTPAPGSARVALVRAFPSPALLQPVAWWAADWATTAPSAAADLAAWGVRQQRTPWLFLGVQARLERAAGCAPCADAVDADAARRLRHALRHAPPWRQSP